MSKIHTFLTYRNIFLMNTAFNSQSSRLFSLTIEGCRTKEKIKKLSKKYLLQIIIHSQSVYKKEQVRFDELNPYN